MGVADPEAARGSRRRLSDSEIQVVSGFDAGTQCALHPEADLVLAAVAGVAGLPAVWAAVQAGRPLAFGE